MISSYFFKNIESAEVEGLTKEIDKLKLDERIVNVFKQEFKFDKLTPVQAATIPQVLKGRDVIVEAKTGSGKTLAFIIPVLQKLLLEYSNADPSEILALILSPTRELALQIYEELYKFTKNITIEQAKNFKSLLLVGGKKQQNDVTKFNKYGANIVVATPGRLSEILERSGNKMLDSIRKNLKYLIMDEADQLLTVGFERNMAAIFSCLPKQRRTCLFSATQTNELELLVKSGLRNPIKVSMSSNAQDDNDFDSEVARRKFSMPDKLKNYYHLVDTYCEKIAGAILLIRNGLHQKVVLFFATCRQVDYFEAVFEEELKEINIPILKLHSRLKNKRKAIFAKLRSKKRYVFLATDILCRGIDIPELNCVIHIDLPQNPESYVHRSGRSGHQLNVSGMSLLMVQKHEFEFVEYCRRKSINLKQIKKKFITCENGELSKKVVYKSGEALTSQPEVIPPKPDEGPVKSFALSIQQKLDQRLKADSKLNDLGKQAFVSYVRFYTSKQCLRQLLFPKLDIKSLVQSFGLLNVPRMPELKNLGKHRRGETAKGRQVQQSDTCHVVNS